MTADSILTEIIEIVKSLPTRDLLHAYLFGSAMNAEKAWSNIDIIFVSENELDGFLARTLTRDLCARYPIDLLIMTIEEEGEFDFIRSENCRWIASNRHTRRSYRR